MTRNGMTLIELMIALTITGIVASSGYATLTTVIDHRERAMVTSTRAQRAGAVRETLIDWVRHAYLPPGSGRSFQGLDRRHGSLSDSELRFVTTGSAFLGGVATTVRLRVARGQRAETGALVAELLPLDGGGGTTIELVPGVHEFAVRYASSLRGARIWLPSWISSTTLPEAVEFRLMGTASDSLHPLLRHPILIRVPGGR